ncbi:MAG: long-chain fatty acid--CoA ligase, partial [Bacteroidota bacterium]
MAITRVFDFLYNQQEEYPQACAVAGKYDGSYVEYSTQEFINIANKISLGLIQLGVKKEDKIAIISYNCPEWNFVDLGLMQLGAVSVPMYPTITEEDYRFIFEHAEVKLVFVENEELYHKVGRALEGIEGVEGIYTFEKVEGAPHWTEVRDLNQEGDPIQIKPYMDQVKPDDLLTLIYTSGTTGVPKGVMLNHYNILSNVFSVAKIFNVDGPNSKCLSFLPICHIFERTGVYAYIYLGVSIYYAESLETISDNLKEVQPDLFAAVPRLLEKVYDKIIAKGMDLTGVKKSLFFWAVNMGLKYDPNEKLGGFKKFQLRMANKLIFSKWREALGNNVKFIVSGGAALQPRLARVFWAGEIPILEAYGLTETSPGVSFSQLEDLRIGCVGPLLDGVEVKIAEDGEVLVKGPNVMMGYYKRPDLTEEAIEADGWFHTGDIGELVENKYLKITDRKKEMFKTSGGKYVAPQLLENKL